MRHQSQFTLEARRSPGECSGELPAARAVLVGVEAVSGSLNFGDGDVWTTVLLIGLGPVTAIPLLLFGYAASKVPLSWMGFMQYISPTLQFLVGVVVMSEPMPPVRLLGFALVWVGLLILMVDAVVRNRRLTA